MDISFSTMLGALVPHTRCPHTPRPASGHGRAARTGRNRRAEGLEGRCGEPEPPSERYADRAPGLAVAPEPVHSKLSTILWRRVQAKLGSPGTSQGQAG